MKSKTDTTPRGPYVCIRATMLVDGRTVGEPICYGTEDECETIALDEPPSRINPALIVKETWRVTTRAHWEAMQNV